MLDKINFPEAFADIIESLRESYLLLVQLKKCINKHIHALFHQFPIRKFFFTVTEPTLAWYKNHADWHFCSHRISIMGRTAWHAAIGVPMRNTNFFHDVL